MGAVGGGGVIGEWVTPAGHPVTLNYRDGTNDWNVLSSVNRPGNEYQLPTGLAGWALDIGGHLGSVSIALAIDNPALHVVCVEPLPDNVAMIRRNVAANDLGDRIVVIEGAAGTEPLVWYGGTGETEQHHTYIGNNHWARKAEDAQTITVRCWSLGSLMGLVKATELVFLKIDCEGCEWSFLDDPLVGDIATIVGEWHPPGSVRQLRALLGRTHDFTFSGEHGFAAVRHA